MSASSACQAISRQLAAHSYFHLMIQTIQIEGVGCSWRPFLHRRARLAPSCTVPATWELPIDPKRRDREGHGQYSKSICTDHLEPPSWDSTFEFREMYARQKLLSSDRIPGSSVRATSFYHGRHQTYADHRGLPLCSLLYHDSKRASPLPTSGQFWNRSDHRQNPVQSV